MRDYLDRLARLVHAIRFDALPESTVRAACAVILDTSGAILGGSRLTENANLARLAAERSGARTATLIGHAGKAEPMLATLANATAGVALEMDEGNRWGGGHPAIHVIPAALAVAEELGADGRRLIEAIVAGYELVSRMGGAARTRPNVHSHGTWGTAGTAASVARLRGRDEGDIRTAINLATSMSPANTWGPCFEGATIRNLYPGRAGLQGILAVHLLDCGYTAMADAPSDVYGTILADEFDPALAVDDLETELPRVFRIEQNYFKFHACCLYNHPALDAVHSLVRAHGLRAESVAHIAVTSIPYVEQMADPEPAAMLAAKFSVPHAVAAAVVLGRTDVAAFLDPAREDPRVRALAKRVAVRGDADMSMRETDRPTARVAITLENGQVFTAETTVVRGDAANPVSRDERVAKFTALATESIGAARVQQVVELVERLGDVNDVRDLTTLLATS